MNCLPMNEKVASQICLTKSIIAQKVIRFCNLDDVKTMNEGQNDYVKTIVLFRDPRGMYSSRKRLLGAEFGAQFGIDAARQSVSSDNFSATVQLNSYHMSHMRITSKSFVLRFLKRVIILLNPLNTSTIPNLYSFDTRICQWTR